LSAAGTPGVVPAIGFDLVIPGITPGVTVIDIFEGGSTDGLQLDAGAPVKFTYLGSEAGLTNSFEVNGGPVFDQSDTEGAFQIFNLAAGILNFEFLTSGAGASAANGGPFGGNLSISFAELTDGSFVALFGDGGGDSDRDDFGVKISVVPLPAAVWLFITAILGLVSVTRVRRQRSIA
jgi:hypothetical protein